MTDINGLTIIENYISKDEEKKLVEFIYKQKWSSALQRRVQHYGYEYSYKYPYTLTKTIDVPPLFAKYSKKIISGCDQIIVNEYEPGQGIGRHTDHKKNFGDKIASISLLSPTMIIFRNGEDVHEIYLQPRSLLIMEDDARWQYTHEIPARTYDIVNNKRMPRSTRVSITFRTVNK